jgi:hypothetical protein
MESARNLSPNERKEVKWWVDWMYMDLKGLSDTALFALAAEMVEKVFYISELKEIREILKSSDLEEHLETGLSKIQCDVLKVFEQVMVFQENISFQAKLSHPSGASEAASHLSNTRKRRRLIIDPEEKPETPETPETPEKPEIPETPEIPEIPEKPETPEVPKKPESVPCPLEWTLSIYADEKYMYFLPERLLNAASVLFHFFSFLPLPIDSFRRCSTCGRYMFPLRRGTTGQYCSKKCGWEGWHAQKEKRSAPSKKTGK